MSSNENQMLLIIRDRIRYHISIDSHINFETLMQFLKWADINVAFGKPVKYSGITETTTEVLTDGLSDSNDPMKTAECPVLAKSNPFFEIDLLDSYPIHFVAIYGKDGEFKTAIAFLKDFKTW